MFLVIWRGFGILVPVIVVGAFALVSCMFSSLPEATMAFASLILSTACLAGMGMFLRAKNKSRHLYWIPMEVWSVATFIGALSQLPKLGA
jgi:hypothetical protein